MRIPTNSRNSTQDVVRGFEICRVLTLNDIQKVSGAHSLLSIEIILGTWARLMSKGPDPDWILCTFCNKPQEFNDMTPWEIVDKWKQNPSF